MPPSVNPPLRLGKGSGSGSEAGQMAGYRGGKHLPAVSTYLAEPKTDDKQDLIDMEEPGLINGLDGFAEAAIAKFLQDEPKTGTVS